MKRVLIIGGGELSKQINHYITNFDDSAEVIGYVDDTVTPGTIRFNTPSLGLIENISNLYLRGAFNSLVMGIGYKHLQVKKSIFERLIENYSFYSFIHPNSYVDKTAKIGQGVIIGPGVVIEQEAIIEDNAFIYNSVSIAHNSKIGKHSFLTPNVAIAGFVSIGYCCNIGVNTIVIDNIKITDNVQTGAGTVVIKNIEQNGLYVGNPARFIR